MAETEAAVAPAGPPLNLDDNGKGQNKEDAIRGSGAAGRAPPRRFVAGKIEVAVANSKGPESLATLVHELGRLVKPVTTAEALRAEAVLLAIRFEAVPHAANGVEWRGGIGGRHTTARDFRALQPV